MVPNFVDMNEIESRSIVIKEASQLGGVGRPEAAGSPVSKM